MMSQLFHTVTFVLCAITEEDGRTALSLCIHHGYLDLLKYLVSTHGVIFTGELSFIFAVVGGNITLTLVWSLT